MPTKQITIDLDYTERLNDAIEDLQHMALSIEGKAKNRVAVRALRDIVRDLEAVRAYSREDAAGE